MTDFRTTAPTLDVVSFGPAGHGLQIIDSTAPIVSAAELVTGLGSRPTVTFPVLRNRPVDIDVLREFLGEPAEFFGVWLPSVDEFQRAIAAFVAGAFDRSPAMLLAATLTLTGDGPMLLTGVPCDVFSGAAVHIGRLDRQDFASRGVDAHWLRMAARTTSSAGRDRMMRGVLQTGCVDGVPVGADIEAPLCGALVLDVGATMVGIDAGDPISMLDQLRDCGVIGDLQRRAAIAPQHVRRAWWVSPRFTTQPVVMLGTRVLPADSTPPSFLEQL